MEINPQRKNYWEPIYSENNIEFTRLDSILSNYCNVPENTIISFDKCIPTIETATFLEGITFKNIDFNSALKGPANKFKFKKCTFDLCGFRNSEFENVSFEKCKFIHSSFSLSKFKNVEFRDCTFKEIGISGNKTIFSNVYVSPELFINNVITNVNHPIDFLKNKGTSKFKQLMRLEQTKTTFARLLERQPMIRADIDTLIESIKIARLTEVKYQILKAKYLEKDAQKKTKALNCLKLISNSIEYSIVYFYGFISGWGLKAGRLIIFGIIGIFFFTILNYTMNIETTLFKSTMRAFEYWFLFGYTKYEKMHHPNDIIIFCNAIFGLIWYGALFPVIFNKLSPRDSD